MDKIFGLTGIESENGDIYRVFVNDHKGEVTLYSPNNIGIVIPFNILKDYVDLLKEICESNNIK